MLRTIVYLLEDIGMSFPFTRRTFTLACAAVFCSSSLADTYPSRTVSVVVPYPAGGASDHVARTLVPLLTRSLGQTVIVENVGGASGAIGVRKVTSAPADGYQVLLGSPMELILAPLAQTSAQHKPEDLKLVGRVGTTSMLLAVKKDLPVSSIDELIAYAKRREGKELTYGSVGPGSLYHLVGARFAQVLGVPMLHIPYKGMAPLMTDLMGGQIDMVFMPFAGPVPAMVADGKVKALGLTARTPHPKAPGLALLATHPALPDFEFNLWSGLQVRRDTPADVTARLNRAMYDALDNPEVRTALESTGSQLSPRMTLADLEKMYTSEIARYRTVARSIDLQRE